MQFIEDRYGEFVLLRPPFNLETLLLWLAPLLVLLSAVVVALRVFARRAPAPGAAPALSGAEEDKLRTLLADAGSEPPSPKTD
jgi:cytochrome c-type biogenesis protein CcmH